MRRIWEGFLEEVTVELVLIGGSTPLSTLIGAEVAM